MADLSHGALLTVDAIKSCLRKMAMMGLNMFLLYREESYYIPEFESTGQFYISLCDMLCLKCDFGVRLRKFYMEDDRIAMECMADAEIPEMIKRLEDMWLKNRTLWFERHQAFGFDVIERRYGALTMRLKTTSYRIHEYLSGRIDSIEELDEPRLPHNKPGKHITYQNGYLNISTAWGR